MTDVSDIQDSKRSEQIAYQESSYHATFVEHTFTYEIWGDDTEPYAVITGVTDAFRDTWGAELRIPEELGTVNFELNQ